MSLLILGGAGFVGCNLALYLNSQGRQVSVMDNLYRRGSELNLKELRRYAIPFYHGDLRNPDDFVSLPPADMIVLAAAQSSATAGFQNPAYDLQTNFGGVVNVLELARKTGAGVIFFSTNKVYDAGAVNALLCEEADTRFSWPPDGQQEIAGFDPRRGISEDFRTDGARHGIYGLSKVCADLACQEWFHSYGVRTVINRCSCLVGGRQYGSEAQGWLAWWMIAAALDLPLTYHGWGGKQLRDVLFIEDLCALIEKQLLHFDRVAGQVFNVGGGMENSLSLLEATAWLESRLKKQLVTRQSPRARLSDHRIFICDTSRSQQSLDWKPCVGLDEGMDRLLEWVVSQKQELAVLQEARA